MQHATNGKGIRASPMHPVDYYLRGMQIDGRAVKSALMSISEVQCTSYLSDWTDSSNRWTLTTAFPITDPLSVTPLHKMGLTKRTLLHESRQMADNTHCGPPHTFETNYGKKISIYFSRVFYFFGKLRI